jgi:hypothetical protein
MTRPPLGYIYMPEDKWSDTFEERVGALRKQISFHRGELSRLHNEYYAAIREAKMRTQTQSPFAKRPGAFIAHRIQ